MSIGRHSEDCAGDAAAYVLGALDEPELASFREHLTECAICRDEVAALQTVVDHLPAAAPPIPAPTELKERVMGPVRREATLLAAAAGTRERSRRRWLPVAGGRWNRGGLAPAASALAALVAVVVTVVAVGSSGGGSATKVFAAHVAGSAAAARAELRRSGDRAELVVNGMPQPPQGRIYEVWTARDGGTPRPTDALFDVSSSGSATVDVPGGVRGVRTVMVTAEPAGGSRAPTRAPVIVANLT